MYKILWVPGATAPPGGLQVGRYGWPGSRVRGAGAGYRVQGCSLRVQVPVPGLKSSDAQGLPGLKSSDAQGLPGLKPWVMIGIIRSGAERLFLKVD